MIQAGVVCTTSPNAFGALMTAWEVLSRIAFGEVRPNLDPADPGISMAAELRALEARAAPEPFCLYEPLILDGHPWDGISFSHPAGSPKGPELLRLIQARARLKDGRLASYGELAARLRGRLHADAHDAECLKRAAADVLNQLRGSAITAR
jgi:hypothetical protein